MTQPAPAPGQPPAGSPTAPDRLGIFSWCLFDWANSAFNTVIGTFVFSVYFARDVYGDEIAGSALWGYTIGLSGLGVAILSPILGAIADRTGRRKPWLSVFVALTVLPTALLWMGEPDPAFVVFALVLVGLSSIAFELSGVFYNAMLPGVAPKPMIGRVSGWGWGLGYFGGLASLVTALFVLIRPDPPLFGLSSESSETIRATAILVAAWFSLFALPIFLFTRDEPPTGVGSGQAIREGLKTLADTIRELARTRRNVLRFLIASALYRDGLITLFAVGGLYAAGTFGMDFDQLTVFAIGLNVTAGLGAIGFGWLDDAIGSKPTVLISIAGLIVFGVVSLLISDANTFIAVALALGIFVGPAQAASRTFMARLAPRHLEVESFGLYALTGKSIAFLGPVLFAAATDAFDSQRAGMSTIILFWLIGGLLLLTVREPKDRRTRTP